MPLPQLRTDYGPDPNMLMMAMKQQRENQLMAREEEHKRQIGNALAQAMSDDPQVAAIAQANPDAVIPYLKVRESQAMHQNALRKAESDEYDTAMGEVANVANYLLQLPKEQRQPIYQQQMGVLAQKYPRVAQKVGHMFPQEADEGFLKYLVASQTPVKDQMAMNKVNYVDFNEGDQIVKYAVDPYGNRIGKVSSADRWQPREPKTPTEMEMYAKAAQGDPGAIATLNEKQKRDIEKFQALGKAKLTLSGESSLSESDISLAQMVADGDIAPSQLAKRTGNYNAVLAKAKSLNPDLDLRQADQDFSTGKTASFRQKDIALQAMPEILGKVRDAGKKLDFSKVGYIGKLEAWQKGQLNDPDFVRYMTLRNDALLSITSAMRGVGATDQAHRAEIEAAPAAMAPEAFDAWYKAQMESLAPRLKANDKIYNRKSKASGYSTPNDVKAAYKAGKLSKPEAAKILREEF